MQVLGLDTPQYKGNTQAGVQGMPRRAILGGLGHAMQPRNKKAVAQRDGADGLCKAEATQQDRTSH